MTAGAGMSDHALFFTSKGEAGLAGGAVKGFGFGDIWGGTCKVKVHIGAGTGADSKAKDSAEPSPSPSLPQPANQADRVKGRATCVLVPPARVKSVKNALEAAGKLDKSHRISKSTVTSGMMAVPVLEGYEVAVDLPSVVEEEAPMNKLMISFGNVEKGSRSKGERWRGITTCKKTPI